MHFNVGVIKRERSMGEKYTLNIGCDKSDKFSKCFIFL